MSSKTFATKNQTDGKWWLVLYVGFVEQRVIFILLLGGVAATSYTPVACMLTTDDTNIARIFIIHFFCIYITIPLVRYIRNFCIHNRVKDIFLFYV